MLSQGDVLLVDVGAGHRVFVVLLVDEDVLLVRIDVALLRDADDVADGDNVGNQGQCADDGHCRGVGVGGAALDDAVQRAVSIGGRQGHPVELVEAVVEGLLEEGEHLCEHTPDGQRVGAVLDPAAAVPEQGSHGRGQQQGDAAEPAVGGQAVVGVGEVPEFV